MGTYLLSFQGEEQTPHAVGITSALPTIHPESQVAMDGSLPVRLLQRLDDLNGVLCRFQ